MNYCCILKQDREEKAICKYDFELYLPHILVEKFVYPYGLFWNVKYKISKRKMKKKLLLDNNYKSKIKLMDICIDYALEYIFTIYGWAEYETEVLLIIREENYAIDEILNVLSKFNAIYTIYGEYNKRYDDIFRNKGLCVKFSNEVNYNEKITIILKYESEIVISGVIYDDIEIEFNTVNDSISNREYSIICREFATRDDIEFLFKNNYVKKMALKSK